MNSIEYWSMAALYTGRFELDSVKKSIGFNKFVDIFKNGFMNLTFLFLGISGSNGLDFLQTCQ